MFPMETHPYVSESTLQCEFQLCVARIHQCCAGRSRSEASFTRVMFQVRAETAETYCMVLFQ
jgi:hypothetical protein